MNFLTKAILRFALKTAGVSTASYQAKDPEFLRLFGDVSHSGKSVTDSSMTQISAVWSCQRILAETIGSLPWAVYEQDDKGNATKVDHPLGEVLINSPNVDMTSVEFREALVLGLCQRGNAYSLIERTGAGQVTSLYPIESKLVTPKRKQPGNTKLAIPEGSVFYCVHERGKYEDYPRDKIWHVKGFGNGFEGLSPLRAAAESMGLALATQEFGARYFSQGGKPSAVVSVPQKLDPDSRKLARESLQMLFGGLENAHKAVLLEGGMTAAPWGGGTLEEMQLAVLLGFSVLEICRYYRVPPHMVADLTKTNYNSAEQLFQEFAQLTLHPYFTRFEASASKWLFKPTERSKFFLKFNFEGLLRADSAGRADFLAKMRQNGFITGNEGRAKENLNRSDAPGMDEFIVQSNMTLVSKLGVLADAQIAGKQVVSPPVQAPAKESTTVNANISLPDSMKHDLKHDVEVSGIREMAAQVTHSQARIEKTVKDFSKQIAGNQERLESVIETLVKVTERAGGPRKAVFDKQGEPIGTIPVERHELH